MDFRSNDKGNVAITVGLMMMVLLLVSSVAIDIGRAVYARNLLQMEIDAAVKAAAASDSATLLPNGDPDPVKIASVARKYFSANHKSNAALIDGSTLAFDPRYRNDGTYTDSVVATLDARVIMSFMKIWGVASIPLHLEAAATRSHPPPLELSLVLDESASMAETLPGGDTKKQEMFRVLFDLVWQVMEPPYYAKVGIVPFTQQVNVKPFTFHVASNYMDVDVFQPKPWLDAPSSYVSNDTNCTTQGQSCTQSTGTCTRPDSTQTTPCTITTCSGGTRTCTPTTVAFDGCVNPRLDSEGQPIADISNPTDPKYPGVVGPCGVSRITDLIDRDAEERHGGANLIMHIIAQSGPDMDPTPGVLSNTFIPSGLLWGWNMLDPAEPLTAGSTATGPERPNRALLLITDGGNNQWPTPEGWNSDPVAKDLADALTKRVCDNIKTTTDIKIYVVAMTIPEASTIAMLRDCASDPSLFYQADTASQLRDAFRQIGRRMAYNSLIK